MLSYHNNRLYLIVLDLFLNENFTIGMTCWMFMKVLDPEWVVNRRQHARKVVVSHCLCYCTCCSVLPFQNGGV